MKVNFYKFKLIIGLGNPGKEYASTYHNVGFLAIDFLDISSGLAKLLKSDTYMNESGAFVLKNIKKYKVSPEEILIIHDDSDIELGKYKISFARGSAGHRGVQSIIDTLGTKNFWRLRIGIGKNTKLHETEHETARKGIKAALPADLSAKASATAETRRAKAGDLVLKKISRKDLEILNMVFQTIKNDIS